MGSCRIHWSLHIINIQDAITVKLSIIMFISLCAYAWIRTRTCAHTHVYMHAPTHKNTCTLVRMWLMECATSKTRSSWETCVVDVSWLSHTWALWWMSHDCLIYETQAECLMIVSYMRLRLNVSWLSHTWDQGWVSHTWDLRWMFHDCLIHET